MSLHYKTFLFASLLFYSITNVNAQTQTNLYNVKNFGAKGDGVNMDGNAINKAIDEAAKAEMLKSASDVLRYLKPR